MVSEDNNPELSETIALRHFNQLLITTVQDLEEEISLLRNALNDLIISNRDLYQEVRELTSEVSLINIHLDRTPTRPEGEEEQDQDPVIEALPVNEDEDRPLRIGDRVRVTSRQQFGIEGVVHSFTNQRVRVEVQGRRRLLTRSRNNLVRLPTN